ncbi:MAG TPA: hypothetical protein VGM03_13110 [Phycisphaerae bacterium]|jgi:Ca2+/Na+ antiporter
MWSTIGKYVGGKVLTAVLVVGSAAALIWFWRHPEQLSSLWEVVKRALAWLGFVLVLPWALFFVTTWVVRRESNLAAGLMLAGYLLLDIFVALTLAGNHKHYALTWVVLLIGFLFSAVYNFVVCEYQADRVEDVL